MGTITIISIYYPPEKGAAPGRIAQMAAGLRAHNLDIEIITALPNYPTGRIFSDYRRKFIHTEIIDSIPVKRFWLYPSNSVAVVKRILNMISFSAMLLFSIPHLLRSRPDTVIVNSPPLPVGLMGVILAKIVDANVVTNVSDIWPLSALELGAIRRGWFYNLLERVEKLIYRMSDAIMTQSEETQQHIVERCPEKNTFLYRNLDHLSEFVDQYPLVEGQPLRIVYAGLLGVAQGVADICKSIDFRELGAEFHIYGDGNEKALISQFIEENPDMNIFIHGAVPKSEIPEILTKFHATIVPLRNNIQGAFPSKIYMAIAASLPVLFCGSGEGATFVRQSGIGWVAKSGDYGALSNNIRKLANMSDSDYISLRNHIKELATNKYDVEDQLSRMIAFIESVRK